MFFDCDQSECTLIFGHRLIACHFSLSVSKNTREVESVTEPVHLIEEDDCKEQENRYPIIGDNVTIFPGAKIIGPVTIGDNCIIGANSVVNKSFPANSIIAGSPARLIRIRK